MDSWISSICYNFIYRRIKMIKHKRNVGLGDRTVCGISYDNDEIDHNNAKAHWKNVNCPKCHGLRKHYEIFLPKFSQAKLISYPDFWIVRETYLKGK